MSSIEGSRQAQRNEESIRERVNQTLVQLTNQPCSLPKATSDPVNVTPPMYVPRNRAVLTTLAAGSVAKCGCSAMKLARHVKTAAAPTRLWNRATICGRSVTSIRLAITVPINAPVTHQANMSVCRSKQHHVVKWSVKTTI